MFLDTILYYRHIGGATYILSCVIHTRRERSIISMDTLKIKTQYKEISDLPLFFNVSTLAKVMGIGKANAYTLCHQKDFPSIFINKRIVISRDAFEIWIQNQTAKK